MEGACVGLVVDGGVHGCDGGRAERTGHVADAHTDYVGFGVGILIGVYSLCHFREEVAFGEFAEVVVYMKHIIYDIFVGV